MFSKPFFKCSAKLSYVLFLTVHPATLISINHPTYLEDGVSVLGVYQEVLDGTATSEMHFNTMFSVDALAAFTHSFNIGHYYVGLVIVWNLCVPGVAASWIGSVGFLLFDIGPMQRPYRVLVSL